MRTLTTNKNPLPTHQKIKIMNIKYFIKQEKSGNILVVTDNGDYTIACSADYGFHYGICKKGDDFFMPINKGKGKKLYAEIIKEIEKNKVSVLKEHIFKPLPNDNDFCEHCGKNFREPIHVRNEDMIHPLFESILKPFIN
jgi:hypothetical protein